MITLTYGGEVEMKAEPTGCRSPVSHGESLRSEEDVNQRTVRPDRKLERIYSAKLSERIYPSYLIEVSDSAVLEDIAEGW